MTYPNTKHHLYNAGTSGASFRTHHEASSCISDLFPSHIDLLVLEHLPFLEQGSAASDAELLLHVLWSHMAPPLPAVLFLNLYRTPGGTGDTLPPGMRKPVLMRKMEKMKSCVSNIKECSQCEGLFDNLPGDMNAAENETHRVAAYYNMASWSYSTFLKGLMHDGVPMQFELSPCQFYASLLRDGTHPTDLGSMLLADVLFDFVQTAVERLRVDNRSSSAAPGLSNISKPLFPQTMGVPAAHCFNAIPKGKTLPGAHRMLPLIATLSQGWSLVEEEGGKLRPGWIGNTTGSRLRISLPLLQPSPAMPTISITFLKSYAHMGNVLVSCISPCECQHPQGVELNGHLAGPNKVSIPETIMMTVSVPTGSECTLELLIIESTDSGEHKFKLMRAGIGGHVVDFPQKLAKLDHDHQQLVH